MSRQIVDRYFAALKTRDVEKIAETFHPEITTVDPLAGTAQGRETARQAFADLYRQMPDALFELVRHGAIDDRAGAVEWLWTATLPSGSLRIPGVDWMEFQDGKIRVLKFYYDPSPLTG